VIAATARVNFFKELLSFFHGDTLYKDARGRTMSIELVANQHIVLSSMDNLGGFAFVCW
jgi:hypothetical protein